MNPSVFPLAGIFCAQITLGAVWPWGGSMRRVWSAITAAFAIAVAVVEIPALRRPKPDDPADDHVYTAWWRWILGLDPKHPRRFVLVPLFVAFHGWFPLHILFRLGPSLRWGPGRARNVVREVPHEYTS